MVVLFWFRWLVRSCFLIPFSHCMPHIRRMHSSDSFSTHGERRALFLWCFYVDFIQIYFTFSFWSTMYFEFLCIPMLGLLRPGWWFLDLHNSWHKHWETLLCFRVPFVPCFRSWQVHTYFNLRLGEHRRLSLCVLVIQVENPRFMSKCILAQSLSFLSLFAFKVDSSHFSRFSQGRKTEDCDLCVL